jgi:hypothetical protein
MRALLLLAALSAASPFSLQAQWTIQTPTTADLRGIDNVGTGIAWASGTNGTVLRTEDAGYLWQRCTIPPGAEHLDFRGIQAFDANTAIVMSSGPGDQSRLYKTTDGCQTWKLIFTNPDKDGFWNAVVADKISGTIIIGDPVGGQFAVFASTNNLMDHWERITALKGATNLKIPPPHSAKESLFAASNSVLSGDAWRSLAFITGGSGGAFLYRTKAHSWVADYNFETFESLAIPVAKGDAAGAFSFTDSPGCNVNVRGACALVIVGGDYKKPEDSTGTAAFAIRAGNLSQPGALRAATTPPHGYRSAVAYDSKTKTWITVGPNGTDISTDDGRNWHPLHPTGNDDPDADQHWNALSLPYAVGPHGRVGILHRGP